MREALRALRLQPWLNRPLTGAARALGLARHEAVVSHLPRAGEVKIELPVGPIRLWSRADDWITSRLWWRGYGAVEGESIDVWLGEARGAAVVLDIGAYNGWYALVAARANPDATVFAFEANPALLARAGYNVALNDLAVTLVPYACSNRVGPVDFHLAGEGLPSASGIDGWAGVHRTITVGATTVDRFVEEWRLPTVDLVKIDVEGHEPSVLEGMAATLRDHRPTLLFEVIAGSTTTGAIVEALEPHGYRYDRLDPDGPVPADGPTPPTDRPYCNYLARSRG